MAKKLILVFLLFLVSGFLGFNIGSYKSEEETEAIKEKVVESIDLNKNVDIKALASVLAPSKKAPKKELVSLKVKESYLKNYLDEQDNKRIFNKTLRIFNDSKNKEGLAVWVTLGTTFDNSKEYTALYENSLAKLNENPDDTLRTIHRKIASLDKKDDFIRGMLNNLVHNLKVEDSIKVDFFGNELNRSVSIGEDGGMGEGSSSIINSLILFKQYAKDDQVVKEYFEQSLNKNTNAKENNALRLRFLTYFPQLQGEI